MMDQPEWMPEGPTFGVPDDTQHAPQPLAPVGTAAVWRFLEETPDVAVLRCACSTEPRMIVHRATVPVWKCAACGSHLWAKTER